MGSGGTWEARIRHRGRNDFRHMAEAAPLVPVGFTSYSTIGVKEQRLY